MKRLLLIVLPLFLSVGFSQQEYNSNDLIEMDNGLWSVKFSDEPISGKVYGYFGEIKPLKKVYIGNLRKGKREGKWVFYYQSTGTKSYEYNFRNGKEDGLSTSWYENGQKKVERTYKGGERNGLQTWWYENGQKEVEVHYKDGDLVKLIGRWNEDGSVRKEPFSWE